MIKLTKNQEIILKSKLWSWVLIDETIPYAEFNDDNHKYISIPSDTKIIVLDIIDEDYESNTLKFKVNDTIAFTAISNLNETMNCSYSNNF